MKKIFAVLTLFVLVLLWSCGHKTVPVSTMPPPANANAPEVLAGKETFTAKCGRCHGLKNPEKFTAERWVGIVDEMAPKARLDTTEKANVLAYVQAYAKKS